MSFNIKIMFTKQQLAQWEELGFKYDRNHQT